MLPAPSPHSVHWTLDPGVVFLNHGSFGACPRVVQQAQQRWRDRMESGPVRFLDRELEALLDTSRHGLAAFLGARAEDLVFVPNATTGVNAVLRSLALRTGDELVVTDHAYNACANALRFVAERSGAVVVVARVPFPLASSAEVVDAVVARVTPRTRLALIDHVTSPTGLVFPVAAIVDALTRCGVDTLVDGAHAPGMVPLALDALGAAFYTGNLHKWVCAPKGAAFLHVRADRHDAVRPTTISHGANSPRRDRPRLLLEFDWTGTADPTPAVCLPDALRFMDSLLPGGFDAVMRHNRALVLAARARLCAALSVPPPCPDDMLGSLASVPLWDGAAHAPTDGPARDDVAMALVRDFSIELPVFPWPARPRRLLRVSAQAYNTPEQYAYLADALGGLRRAT